MQILYDLAANQVLMSAVASWVVAQILKTLIDLYFNHSFNPERLVGAGGMPSSHSATVCGLTMAAGMRYGLSSFQFAISFILATVVMFDATGVRRETGKQAKLLNELFFENIFNFDLGGAALQEKLKEYVGHTPVQVVAGALIGIATAAVVGSFYA